MNLEKKIKQQLYKIKKSRISGIFIVEIFLAYTAKLSPQAQVRLALGLLK